MRDRLAQASFWLASAKFLNNFLSAFSTIILAWILVPEDFGIVALASAFILVASSVTELSLGEALINVEKPEHAHLHTVWTLSILRSLLVSLVLSAAAHPVAVAAHDLRIEPVLYVLLAGLGISGFTSPRLAMLERNLQFKQAFALSLASNTVTFAVTIILALVFRNYWAIALGSVAGQIGKVIASYLIAPYGPRLSWSKAQELWRFSVWLSLSQIVSTLNYRADQLMVGWMLGRAELGYYTVGGRIAQTPGREVVAPLTATLYPALVMLRDDRDRLLRGYVRAQTLVTFIALPVTSLVALFAHPTIRFLLGEHWMGAVLVIQTVAASTAFETLGGIVTPLAMAQGQTDVLFRRDLLKLCLRLPMILVGLVLGGLTGLLIARSAAGLLSALIDILLVKSLIGLSLLRQLRHNMRCLTATAAMAVMAIVMQEIVPDVASRGLQFARLALLGTSSVAVFVLVAALLWRASRYDDGPEGEILGLFQSATRKLGRSRQPG